MTLDETRCDRTSYRSLRLIVGPAIFRANLVWTPAVELVAASGAGGRPQRAPSRPATRGCQRGISTRPLRELQFLDRGASCGCGPKIKQGDRKF